MDGSGDDVFDNFGNNHGNEGGNYNNNNNHNRNNNDDYERYKAALEHNVRRTDVRLFLTQRAMQSFIHLLIACRDPHTVRWLEVRAT